MKIIINENRLNKIIGKWLNSEYGDLDVYDHNDEPLIFYVDKEGDIIFLYETKSNELYVSIEIIKFFYSMFSIDIEQTKDILVEWFEKHTGLKPVQFLSWDFTTDSMWKNLVTLNTKKRLDN